MLSADGDAQALEQQVAAQACRTAFAPLVVAYEAPLSRYMCRLVGDPELARDLVQDTFLSAYRAWPPADQSHVSAWLYRIATNHALAYLRRRRLLAWFPFSRLAERLRTPSADGLVEDVVERASVAAALARLDERDRACLLLRAAGFSGEELAGLLGCSAVAARKRISRARAAFARLYDGEEATCDE